MAISNAELVLMEQARLYKAGLIGLDEDGMYEPLLTYAEWKKRGFQVKKGEHAITKFAIWKPKTRKQKQEEEENNLLSSGKPNGFFLKNSAFFIRRQVASPEELEAEPTKPFKVTWDLDPCEEMEDYI